MSTSDLESTAVAGGNRPMRNSTRKKSSAKLRSHKSKTSLEESSTITERTEVTNNLTAGTTLAAASGRAPGRAASGRLRGESVRPRAGGGGGYSAPSPRGTKAISNSFVAASGSTRNVSMAVEAPPGRQASTSKLRQSSTAAVEDDDEMDINALRQRHRARDKAKSQLEATLQKQAKTQEKLQDKKYSSRRLNALKEVSSEEDEEENYNPSHNAMKSKSVRMSKNGTTNTSKINPSSSSKRAINSRRSLLEDIGEEGIGLNGTTTATKNSSELSRDIFSEQFVEGLLDPDTCESTLNVLIDMKIALAANAKARDALSSKTKVCYHIVSVMIAKEHIQNAAIHIKCARLISGLTFRHHEANIQACLETGAASFLVASMKRFSKRRDMQLYGIGALRNFLVCSHKVKTFPSTKDAPTSTATELVFKAEGIEAIVAAMKKFPNEKLVLEQGCGCLLNLIRQLSPQTATATWSLSESSRSIVHQHLIELGAAAVLATVHSQFVGTNETVEHLAEKSLALFYSVTS